MSTNGDTLEREAGEHIDNLREGLHLPEVDQTCSKLHGDTCRALIWVIRKLEALFKAGTPKSGIVKVFKLGSIEIPLERGLTFRDLLLLIVLSYFIYVHIQTGVNPL